MENKCVTFKIEIAWDDSPVATPSSADPSMNENQNVLQEIQSSQEENNIVNQASHVFADQEKNKNAESSISQGKKRKMTQKCQEESTPKKQSSKDVKSQPKKKKKPNCEQIDLENLKSFTSVFFDLETTSLHLSCDILQIAAMDDEGDFNVYVKPTQSIDPRASEITGLTFKLDTLKHWGNPVPAVTRKKALDDFLAWIKGRSPVILYAHNAKFDYKRLFHAITEEKLVETFKPHIVGFVDTIPLFKLKFPGLRCYRLGALVEKVLKKSFDAHNASADVKAMKELHKASITEMVPTGSVTFASAYETWQNEHKEHEMLEPFKFLIRSKYLTKANALKIAEAGLAYEIIESTYNNHGFDKLTEMLGNIVKKQVIEKIASYFQLFISLEESILFD